MPPLMRSFLMPLMFVLCAACTGCTPAGLALGAGAATGVAAAQEGGLQTSVTDKAIYVRISDAWFKNNFDLYRRLTLTVKEGRVLVAGTVPYPDMRVTAIRLAWQAEGVKQVINEIKVEDKGGGVGAYVTDTWITGNIKTRLLLDKYIQSINYTIDTVNGTVYIMGVAQDQAELDRVLSVARRTAYVKNVVSYARRRGERLPNSASVPSSSEPVTDNAPSAAPALPLADTTSAPPIPQAVQTESLSP